MFKLYCVIQEILLILNFNVYCVFILECLEIWVYQQLTPGRYFVAHFFLLTLSMFTTISMVRRLKTFYVKAP